VEINPSYIRVKNTDENSYLWALNNLDQTIFIRPTVQTVEQDSLVDDQ